MTGTSQTITKLGKFLNYVLGRRPDEFGLILDADGYIKVKDLLKALSEDQEWRFVRLAHLNELVLTTPLPSVEMKGSMIRARLRNDLPQPEASVSDLPKLLYTAVRRRAYAWVHEKGVHPGPHQYVVLSPNRGLALRIGRRLDNDPVILIVGVTSAQSAGIQFQQYGETLYLADFIPPGVFSGPPLPDIEKAASKAAKPAEKTNEPLLPRMPGSFFPDPSSWSDDKAQKSGRRRSEKEWKKERRQARREKNLRR